MFYLKTQFEPHSKHCQSQLQQDRLQYMYTVNIEARSCNHCIIQI